MASKVNSAMATIQTAIEALTPVSDGSAAVYAFIDDFVEERGNGQHRQLIWDMPTTWRAGDVVETRERTLNRIDVLGADEAFLTGTGARVVPVHALDGVTIGEGRSGTVTRLLTGAFDDYARCHGVSLADGADVRLAVTGAGPVLTAR